MKLSAPHSARTPSCVITPSALLSPVVLLLGLALACAPSAADILDGRVVGVTDGDTVTVLDAAKTEYRIRVAGIDAPEKAMPWGQKSKQALSDQVYGRDVRVDWSKRDRYVHIPPQTRHSFQSKPCHRFRCKPGHLFQSIPATHSDPKSATRSNTNPPLGRVVCDCRFRPSACGFAACAWTPL